MTGGPQGPTRGAFEQPADRRWEASPRVALLIRATVFASPVAGAFGGLFLVSPLLFRPPGWSGLALWFVQGLIVGTAISMSIERVARQLLPLASLFTMSLIFPDQAPSRFGVALRSGTMRRMADRTLAQGRRLALPDDPGAAAITAVEYMTSLSRHDRRTRGHTERVRAYADLIGAELGLSNQDRQKLTWGVMLHDIGKLAVPPEILNKQGQLTADEWAVLKTHPAEAERLLEPLRGWLGPWARAASEHHERWDGGGYPHGLQGAEISLAGRITAVADAYDVITSARSYKEPMSAAAARRELVLCAGTQFDPDVVRAFLNVSLGRRWSAGVLAATSHLPIGNLGSAPAAVSVGAVITAGAVAVGAPPPEPIEVLAFGDEPSVIVEDVPETPIDSSSTSSVVVVPGPTSQGSSVEAGPAATEAVTSTTTADASTTTGATTSATTGKTTTTTRPTTTTTRPTTITTVATTAPATAPPTTTTTAPPTTTTAPPTTTTAPPAGQPYYLEHTTGWLASDSEGLTRTAPGGALADYDASPDGIQGMRLDPTTGDFESEKDPTRNLVFVAWESRKTLSGTATVTLWVAADGPVVGPPPVIEVDIAANCGWTSCDQLAVGSAVVTQDVAGGFQQVTIPLTIATAHEFGWSEPLMVRFITRGTQSLHLAYDAATHPSAISLQIG